VDTVQFYQCWVSRSIGSYPKNIFPFPLDYYQGRASKPLNTSFPTNQKARF
jgi:hypothetical protein